MEKEKRYSTIRISSHKAHVYDHKNKRVLCGTSHLYWTPFKINKTKYQLPEMLKRHKAFAERRGGYNPYKFTCIKCENILIKLTENYK